MLTSQVALAAISVSALTYGALTMAVANVNLPSVSMRKVGGIRFLRVGRMQFSFCRTRPAPVITAERLAMASKRAATREAVRLDTIARQWVQEGR